MKMHLLFPPQWLPLNPHNAMITLSNSLRKNNFDINFRDLNIEYYNFVLNKDYLKRSVNKALSMQQELFNTLSKEYKEGMTEFDYTPEFRKNLLKYEKIKEFKTTRIDELEQLPDEIDDLLAIMRDKEKFYNPLYLLNAMTKIDNALEVASLPYYPSVLSLHSYTNQYFKLTFESIKECCLDKSTNMFYDFYEFIIPSILEENPNSISISINSSSQIVPGLTLAMLLKQTKKAHINIGGNFFTRVTESLINRPEFFETFVDSVGYAEGEKPIVEFAKYINGQISIEEVPNLMYLQNGIVKCNPKAEPLQLDEISIGNLEDFPIDLYFTPEIVFPVQSSRGCYWGKCSFCDEDFGQNHSIKNSDKLISELEYLKKTYNISHFEFVDESISSEYLKEFSEKVINSKLGITWFNNARLENEFNKELLEKAHEAGLRMLLWGFESGSKRIMKLINKGIEIDKRLDILKTAHEIGIWNFAFIFFGFPSETHEDAMETIDIISKNTDIINSYGRSVFSLGKHTRLQDNPEKYFISEIKASNEEFSPSYKFTASTGLNEKEIAEVSNLCTQNCNKAYNNPLWMYLRYREIIFLYICKFGAHDVQSCKVS